MGLRSCSIHEREIILEIVCFVVIFKSNMLKYNDSSASMAATTARVMATATMTTVMILA